MNTELVARTTILFQPVSQALDVLTTYLGVSVWNDASLTMERNPVMRWLWLAAGPLGVLVLKVALGILAALALYYVYRRQLGRGALKPVYWAAAGGSLCGLMILVLAMNGATIILGIVGR